MFNEERLVYNKFGVSMDEMGGMFGTPENQKQKEDAPEKPKENPKQEALEALKTMKSIFDRHKAILDKIEKLSNVAVTDLEGEGAIKSPRTKAQEDFNEFIKAFNEKIYDPRFTIKSEQLFKLPFIEGDTEVPGTGLPSQAGLTKMIEREGGKALKEHLNSLIKELKTEEEKIDKIDDDSQASNLLKELNDIA